MPVTQKEIAQQLNVSIATVSRSLQSDPAIAPHTRGAVMQLAASLGYRHRHKNRRSRAHEILQIGVLVRTQASAHQQDHNPTFSRFLAGMSEASRPMKVSLSMDFVPPQLCDAIHLPENLPLMIREGIVKGLILVGYFHPQTVAALNEMLPCVRIAQHDPSVSMDCVDHDDMRSMLLLIKHLKAKGHQKIGLLRTGTHLSFNRSRTAAFVEAMMVNEQSLDPELILQVDDTKPDGFAIAAEQIKQRSEQGITAWICTNDELGYHQMQALTQAGMDVPADISLCGFDNQNPPSGCVKLTSINAPFQDMGAVAVRVLREKLDSPPREPMRLMMSTWLVEAQSVKDRNKQS
ncbi:MAG: LacI family DNA-binding transcriptional regulator [Phycisphaeraceae bacterium JB051]